MILKNKNVLVTGADGFIGSHLVERLVEEGCKVRAFVFYNSFNSWGWLESIPADKLKNIDVFAGDVRDYQSVLRAAKDADLIFHLAALIGIPFSYSAPDAYVDTNIRGTLNILNAAKQLKTKKVLVTSTSEVYGTAIYAPIKEDHPLQGQSPYSATKIGADKLAESFFRSFELPVTIVRPFNTYGPRQSARAVIPTIISQLLAGSKEIRLGSLTPKRDFNYVKDTCGGFVAIAKSDKVIGEEINIASEREIDIGHLAGMIIKKIDTKARVVLDSRRIRPKESEVGRLLGSNDKIRRLTGWRPEYSLDKGLGETIDWFRDEENIKLYKPHIYNV